MKKNDYVSKSPFKERMDKMVSEFRDRNQQFLKGTYKPPSTSEEKDVPSKKTPEKPKYTPATNVDYRKKAYARQLNKYQGGE